MEGAATQNASGFSAILQSNKNEMSKIKDFEKSPISTKARNILFGVTTVGSVIVLGMFATTIIHGVAALVVTGLFVGGSFFSLRMLKTLDPLIQQKTKNFKIEAMIKAARGHAIAQLSNQILDNEKRLFEAREARDKMGALVERLRSQISSANAGSPMHEKKKAILDRVKESYTKIVANVDKAALSFTAFENKVSDYKEMEAFAALAGEAMSYFNRSDSGKLDEMLSLAAFEQIETDFNGALISIENSARDMDLDN